MIVARSLEEISRDARSVVTVGTFDGMHAGHQAIVREVTSRSKARGGRSAVVTFEPHPRTVLQPVPVPLLSTLSERVGILQEAGIDLVLAVRFTYEFSRQTSREFYERTIVGGVGAAEVIVGSDHHFGRDREAGLGELDVIGREFGFVTSVVPPVSIDGGVVSSSRIRRLLEEGKVEQAERLLLRPYAVSGTVVRGDGRGASLGFPTANIRPDAESKLVPAGGVYVAAVDLEPGRRDFGMLNIGTRPTFGGGGQHRTIEVHVFGFSGDLYGHTLGIRFLRRLRDEKTFASPDALVRQLAADRAESMKVIAEGQH